MFCGSIYICIFIYKLSRIIKFYATSSNPYVVHLLHLVEELPLKIFFCYFLGFYKKKKSKKNVLLRYLFDVFQKSRSYRGYLSQILIELFII